MVSGKRKEIFLSNLDPKDDLTQASLKQSWEQKKLSLIPSLRHVGHWRVPASFSHSARKHFLLAVDSEFIVTRGLGQILIWNAIRLHSIDSHVCEKQQISLEFHRGGLIRAGLSRESGKVLESSSSSLFSLTFLLFRKLWEKT
jgi:hypothetical protein